MTVEIQGSLDYNTIMLPRDIYSQAHLFVASIRVYEHLYSQPPSLKGLSELLRLSEEELSRVSRRLEDEEIIGTIKSGGDSRFVIRDYGKIESLPRSPEAAGMEQEISQFKSKQESRLKELEESLGKKGNRSAIFSELEKALKDPSQMKKKNPLD
jgi:DNA-binding transcriptional regulator GbsR (MarR family)